MKLIALQRLRTVLTMALFALLCVPALHAAPTQDEINAAILADGSMPVQWTNDASMPWTVSEGVLKSGNAGVPSSTSTIKFNFTSDVATEVSFQLRNLTSYSHEVLVYINGILKAQCSQSDWETFRFNLDPGTYTFQIADEQGSVSSTGAYANMCNVKVRQILDLSQSLLATGSMPITFENDPVFPWTVGDGYASRTLTYSNTASNQSSIKAHVKVETASCLKFVKDIIVPSGYTGANLADFALYVNGEQYWLSSTTSETKGNYVVSRVLEPGEYELEWRFVRNNSYTSKTATAYLSNVLLTDAWVEVNITPGMLGVETLYKIDRLQDVTLLKINGRMNADDWATIKQMTNLQGIDFSGCTFTVLPAEALNSLPVKYVVLPESLEEIGSNAFQRRDLRKINIPANVQTIGEYAFSESNIREINFAADSRLTTIGKCAFEATSLKEFIMPHSVTSLGTHCFYNCTSLEKLHFSDGLTELGKSTACMDPSGGVLSEVKLPADLRKLDLYCFYGNKNLRSINLPASLRTIGDYAFEYCGLDSIKIPIKTYSLGERCFGYCPNLQYVELPASINAMNYTFHNCKNIKTVVCPAVTPPSISSDWYPFSGVSISSVTLRVPEVSVVSYKLDPYWYQFGKIEMGVNPEYIVVQGKLSLNNNRRFIGKPDVEMWNGGSMIIGGTMPVEIGTLDMYQNSACILNSGSPVFADSVSVNPYSSKNTWRFFTPLADTHVKDLKFPTAAYALRTYDGARRAISSNNNGWTNVTDSILYAGKGYIYQHNVDDYLRMPVRPENHYRLFTPEAVSLPLNEYQAVSPANANWNFIGNPYPCFYDIWYMDFSAPITVWTGSTYKAYSTVDDSYALKPMQAFFVQKPADVEAINFPTEGKQVTATIDHSAKVAARRPVNRERVLFDIELCADTLADQTRVVFNPKADMAYELSCDAAKFMSDRADMPQLYTTDAQGTMLAINERPDGDGNLPLTVVLPEGRKQFSIRATRAAGGEAYLYDALTRTETDIVAEEYAFTSEVSGTVADRFVLRLNRIAPLSVGNAAVTNAKITADSRGISVCAAEGCAVNIYTADGMLRVSATATGADDRYELPAGVYIVKTGTQSVKAVVQ